ncbi:small ribosomal subunit protein mS47-like isoform X1 [Castanea sativa]|uniref:small ribosomal subunit protein mS47-like isoform X1 n=2 Tax=Castanea sativa TaxID=21020 RepID=UPI003F64A8A0
MRLVDTYGTFTLYWEYLGLIGEKLNGAEMISCGLATHYAHSSKLALIEEQLGKLDTDDPSAIETSLEKYSDLVYLDNISVLHRIEILDKCFSHDTVEEIIDSLWNPPRLEQVSKDMVEHYFSPLSKSEPELELPTEVREAFT